MEKFGPTITWLYLTFPNFLSNASILSKMYVIIGNLFIQGTLWFNIGSVDSLERNLENVQMEMNIDAPNWVPVVYKTEIEPSSFTGFIPTLLIIGKTFDFQNENR